MQNIEHAILLLALAGSAKLSVAWIWETARWFLTRTVRLVRRSPLSSALLMEEIKPTTSAVSDHTSTQHWSEYESPTCLRRGFSVPVAVVEAKVPPAASTAPVFDLVA